MRTMCSFNYKLRKFILLFLLPLSLSLIMYKACELLDHYITPLLREKFGREYFSIKNHIFLVIHFINVFIIIYIFYLIGKRTIYLEKELWSSIILMFFGFYIADVIRHWFSWRVTKFPLTIELIWYVLITVLMIERNFFIALAAMAIGYIRAKTKNK